MAEDTRWWPHVVLKHRIGTARLTHRISAADDSVIIGSDRRFTNIIVDNPGRGRLLVFLSACVALPFGKGANQGRSVDDGHHRLARGFSIGNEVGDVGSKRDCAVAASRRWRGEGVLGVVAHLPEDAGLVHFGSLGGVHVEEGEE